ncbi:(2Fe-2S) ferredoxin domain-containing protein [Desulfosarcina ovata]|uniref:Uncharacterized protein n=2 Tax=Desulfosarcina ovata TaxID=83564 RepID=A0A5K8AF01_9BACT|nr:(2Fe-2S) ferredoxin domain-containing protein [Desulfosarcina ovata]BBO84733.1 hypothetical protein DSCO28_52990 [Desulfosarcina ovata subsp. sediminis]BBO91225.1 hypothetical protein DSCOOX_44050 [Desulfosarcina ovata subsp. ovata]
MAKRTIADLDRIREAQKDRMAFKDRTYLFICGGTGCHATGSIRVKDALVGEIEEKGLADKVQVIEKELARIDKEKCIQCLTYYDKCRFDAIL